MSRIFVRAEQVIDAKPEEVYASLADYKNFRPRILTDNFQTYTVEKGGKGDGTVVDYRLKAAKREREYRMKVEETVKGKVITERDNNSSLLTRWIVQSLNNRQQSRVSVETEWEGGSGIKGFFERTFAPMGLRKIYDNMLTMLALQVQSPEKNRVLVQQSTGGLSSQVKVVVAAGALALGLALGVGYLIKRTQ